MIVYLTVNEMLKFKSNELLQEINFSLTLFLFFQIFKES